MFVTLQPKNGLFTACFLALAGAVLYAGSFISITRREEHLDDAGYRFRGKGVRAAGAAPDQPSTSGAARVGFDTDAVRHELQELAGTQSPASSRKVPWGQTQPSTGTKATSQETSGWLRERQVGWQLSTTWA